MITFVIVGIVVIVLVKFLIYASKPENQIESQEIQTKFKPFIDAILQNYLQIKINCTIKDFYPDNTCLMIQTESLSINQDTVSHFLYLTGDQFFVESTYTVFELKFRKIYNFKISKMDGLTQKMEAKEFLNNFFDEKIKFQEENESLIIEKMMDQHLYN